MNGVEEERRGGRRGKCWMSVASNCVAQVNHNLCMLPSIFPFLRHHTAIVNHRIDGFHARGALRVAFRDHFRAPLPANRAAAGFVYSIGRAVGYGTLRYGQHQRHSLIEGQGVKIFLAVNNGPVDFGEAKIVPLLWTTHNFEEIVSCRRWHILAGVVAKTYMYIGTLRQLKVDWGAFSWGVVEDFIEGGFFSEG
jgi:hypothetical protein